MFRRDRIAWLVKQGLTVGQNFSMLEDVYIDPSHLWLIAIGNDVTLAPRTQILAHDASTKQHLGKTRLGKVVIGDRVFVGASAIILPGVTIGSEVIIGAGSVVTKDIPSGVVVAGNSTKGDGHDARDHADYPTDAQRQFHRPTQTERPHSRS
ncbi:MAG: hypothetical protein H8K07_22820 [Nitrospira sp.]|nr:hypothetical protein [Nitrospira sp.]